jgi:predicted small secreted protein
MWKKATSSTSRLNSVSRSGSFQLELITAKSPPRLRGGLFLCGGLSAPTLKSGSAYSLEGNKIMKAWATIASIFLIAVTLTACQTIQGAGRDIQNAGEALESAVD